MSREEAITLIKSAQLMLINPTTNEPISDLHMALDMAISALEQITQIRKAIVEAEEENLHLSYPVWCFMRKIEKIVGEKQIGEFEQEPCDDAISRDELLKAIDTWDKFGVDDTNSLFRLDNLSLPHYVPYIHYDDVIKCIKGMPSVTQKSDNKYRKEAKRWKNKWLKSQKSGKWIHFAQSDDCSLCGYSTGKYGSPSKYCPNCGAKMAESEE